MNSDENPGLQVTFILDAIGRPKEHLVEALERVSNEIDNEKGVSVKSKDIKEPKPLKEREDFFTTFAELDLEFDSIDYLMGSIFKYMPAHIEIVNPEVIALSNNRLNEVINELARRLHGYDEIARSMQLENKKLRQMVAQATGKETQTPFSPKSNMPQSQPDKKAEKKDSKKESKKKSKKSSSKKKSKKKSKSKKSKKTKKKKSSKKK